MKSVASFGQGCNHCVVFVEKQPADWVVKMIQQAERLTESRWDFSFFEHLEIAVC